MFLIFVWQHWYYLLGVKTKKTAMTFIPRAAVSQVPKQDRHCRGLYVSGNFLGYRVWFYRRLWWHDLYASLLDWLADYFILNRWAATCNLGKFTFCRCGILSFFPNPSTYFAASGTLVVVALYLVAQMVGAGKLVQLLFGLDYVHAVIMLVC